MAIAIFPPLSQFFDNDGDPLNGGTVTVQDAGTTTSRNIYTDTALSVGATNPVPLDSAGRPTQGVIYTAATAYKLILKDSGGSTIRTEDNLDPGIPVGSGVLDIANGGTGGATEAAARAALGAVGTTDIEDLEAEVAALAGAAGSSEKTSIAVGTTAQRPGSPAVGDIRHNTTTTEYEGYISGGWDNFMFESANAASTGVVTAETAGATFIRPDRLSSSNRVAKVLGLVTYSAGTPTLRSEVGVASITDTSPGVLTVTFDTAFADTFYIPWASASQSGGSSIANVVTRNVGSMVINMRADDGTLTDPVDVSFGVFDQ
jgi:hypothetical protein